MLVFKSSVPIKIGSIRAMAVAFIKVLATLTSTTLWQDSVQYYCGNKTFTETPVNVSKDAKFVTDVTADSMQDLSLLLDPTSFKIEVTGCLTPKGELRPATGVEINFQNLPSIYSGAIQNLMHLQMIKMEHCGIQEIYAGAFMILPSIEVISLRFNRIQSIREGVFSDMLIAKLYLSNNSISYIEDGAFDNMPMLAVVELDSNILKNWNTDWFTNSPNVEHLSLDSNQLTKLPANAFNKLKNYYSTSIRLTNNEITFIHPTAFRGLDLLYALWLDNNNIDKLDDEVFLHFERLYILSLSGNRIACLSKELLYSLRSEDIILHVEDNEPMSCECLRRIENWARSRGHFFTERYARAECNKKRRGEFVLC